MGTAYLINGEEVEVVERLSSGVVIQRLYEREDGEPWIGEPEIVSEVFDKPPTEKRSELIVTLETRIAELRQTKTDLEKGERELKQRLEKFKKYPSLDLLEDALEGRLTHYVIQPEYGSWRIIEVAKAFVDEDDRHCYDRAIRLLSIMAKPGALPEWKLNRYSWGNGHSDTCWPVTSYEAALEKMQSLLDEATAEAIKQKKRYDFAGLVATADAYGLTIADEARTAVVALKVERAVANVAECKKKFEDAKTELASLSKEPVTA